jgi:ubiquitin C-terminal hydrolase
MTRVQCLRCHNSSDTFSEMFAMGLPLPENNGDLTASLKKYCEVERLEGDN